MSVDICRPQAGEGSDSSSEAYHVAQSGSQLVICATARIGDSLGHAKVYNSPSAIETLPTSGLTDSTGSDPVLFNNVPLPDTTLSSDPYYLAVWNSDYSESQVHSFCGGSAPRTECACPSRPPTLRDLLAQESGACREMQARVNVTSGVVRLATPLGWNLMVRQASGAWKIFKGHWYLALKSTTFGGSWIWENTKKDKNGHVPRISLSTDASPVAKLFTLTFPLTGQTDIVYTLSASYFRLNAPNTLSRSEDTPLPQRLTVELG